MQRSAVPRQSGGTAANVLLVLGGAALLFVAIYTAAALKRNSVVHSWEPAFGTLESIVERYPATEVNSSALEIERIGAELGADIVPQSVEDRVRPAEDVKRDFGWVKKHVFNSYLKAMLEQPATGALEAPPEEFGAYLARHDDSLRELRAALTEDRIPAVWRSDISLLAEAPIPNLLGHIDLVKLMTSAALERLWAGDEATALQYLDAGSQLTRGLRDSPIIINQLILIAETRILAGALRHVDAVPDGWLERFDYDYRGALLQAMKYEGWVLLYTDGDEDLGNSAWEKAVKLVAEPYARYCLADVSGRWRERIENLERVESICDYDLAAQQADMNIPVPRWNHFGQIFVPNLGNAVYRVSRLELDLELTRLILEAKRNPLANDVSIPSRACSEDSWTTAVDDGELRLDFSRELVWSGLSGPFLPTIAQVRIDD